MSVYTEQAISLPFSFTPTGNVQTTTDQNKIWADRVLAVLGTSSSERVQRYYFGNQMYSAMLYNTADEAQTIIEREVNTAFSAYLPTLNLVGVDFFYNDLDNTLSTTVMYKLPDNTQLSTQIGSIVVGGNTPPKDI